MAKRVPAARVSVVAPMRVALLLSVVLLVPALGFRVVIAWMYWQAIGRALHGDLSGVDEAQRADSLVPVDAIAVVVAVVMVTLAIQRWREACFANASSHPDIGADWMSRTRSVREYLHARRIQLGCYLALLATGLIIHAPDRYDRQTFENIRPLFLLQVLIGLVAVVTAIGIALIVRRMTSELTTMIAYAELLERRRAEQAGEDPDAVGAEYAEVRLRRDWRESYRGLTWWQTVLAVLPLGLVQSGGAIGGGIGGAGAAANLSLARKELPTAVKALAMTCVVAVTYGAGFAALAAVRSVLPQRSTTATQGSYYPMRNPARPQPPGSTRSWTPPTPAPPQPPAILAGVPGIDMTASDALPDGGVRLSWRPYVNSSGDPSKDLVGYEVYRSASPSFTPSQASHISSVPSNLTTYQDIGTPAVPPGSQASAYYYMVVARTAAGLVPGRIHPVRLPVRITLPATAANMLVAFEPTVAKAAMTFDDGSHPWLTVGDYTDYAKTTPGPAEGASRAVFAFGALSAIPRGSFVTEAHLTLTTEGSPDPEAPFELHALTRSFTSADATWNRATAASAWTHPGGDFGPVQPTSPQGPTSPPAAQSTDPVHPRFDATGIVRGWIASPGTAYGLLLKGAAEKPGAHHETFDGVNTADPTRTPTLTITYLPATVASTYDAPATPQAMKPAATATVPVTITNCTATTMSAGSEALTWKWTSANGTNHSAAGATQVALPRDLTPGDTVTLDVPLTAPQLRPGQTDEQEALTWDLYNKSTHASASALIGGTLNQKVEVSSAAPTQAAPGG